MAVSGQTKCSCASRTTGGSASHARESKGAERVKIHEFEYLFKNHFFKKKKNQLLGM